MSVKKEVMFMENATDLYKVSKVYKLYTVGHKKGTALCFNYWKSSPSILPLTV